MAAWGWLTAAKERQLAIFRDPDQGRIRNDLRTFFGPRADKFLALYERMRAGAETGRISPMTWSWIVFFTTFPWFFYRKMYAWGATLIVVPIALALLFPSMSGAGMVAFAAIAKTTYVNSALGRLRKADELGLTGPERDDYLRRAGGVSPIAAVLSGILCAVMLSLAIFSIYVELQKL